MAWRRDKYGLPIRRDILLPLPGIRLALTNVHQLHHHRVKARVNISFEE
jgi:hypothetical protein